MKKYSNEAEKLIPYNGLAYKGDDYRPSSILSTRDSLQTLRNVVELVMM